ncbi:MAG: fused MFS/spermidine synthase [Candidatus Omnitrophica bacterium]|nr:fused MFS/spermidine synthase [Candidatus Omnitrophota bacterium]
MNNPFILTIIIVGLSGIIAQVIILRELLISFYGNELTLGIILANWVLLEAIGVFTIGRLIDKARNKINIFILLQIVFSVSLPVAIYLSRTFKGILGVPFGEALGLNTIFFSSFLIMLPLAFSHGGLFGAACKIYSIFLGESDSIGRVYAWETIGTIIGGIIFTYLFIPYLNSFQTAFIISIANIIICLLIFKYRPARVFKYLVLLLFIAGVYSGLAGGVNYLQHSSITSQWNIGKVLDYRNSVYGNVVVIKKEKQDTFFYNGLPVITTPYPDIGFVEEFGHLPLLFHPGPKDLLIISGGAGGVISEILKHPVIKIDYLELDPLIIEMLKKHSSGLAESELNNNKLNLINQDGRYFLRNSPGKYDIVLVGVAYSADLSTNRFFTQEFFSLAKSRMSPDGILAFRLPGSLVYLSRELRDLNVCILNAAQINYKYVRIIPGDYNLFLASDSKRIMEANPALITQKINQQNIKTNILVPEYLEYRLDQRRSDWFKRSCLGATKNINKDFIPFAVVEMLVSWNKQFSPGLGKILEYSINLNLKLIFLFLSIFTALLFFLFRRRPGLNIAYCIFTTGFFGMLTNLILIFAFQVFYGYLYQSIGLLITIFMTGIALGSIFISRQLPRIKNDMRLFINLEIAIAAFSYILALILARFSGYLHEHPLVFLAMSIIPGMLIGLEFPLASKMYLKKKGGIGQTAGLLYSADLIGGWLAGILGAIVFVPIIGLFNTCVLMAIFKISSALLFLLTRKIF